MRCPEGQAQGHASARCGGLHEPIPRPSCIARPTVSWPPAPTIGTRGQALDVTELLPSVKPGHSLRRSRPSASAALGICVRSQDARRAVLRVQISDEKPATIQSRNDEAVSSIHCSYLAADPTHLRHRCGGNCRENMALDGGRQYMRRMSGKLEPKPASNYAGSNTNGRVS